MKTMKLKLSYAMADKLSAEPRVRRLLRKHLGGSGSIVEGSEYFVAIGIFRSHPPSYSGRVVTVGFDWLAKQKPVQDVIAKAILTT